MLKYFALYWDRNNPEINRSANRLAHSSIRDDSQWKLGIRAPGFAIFFHATGATSAIEIEQYKGVILGEIYKKHTANLGTGRIKELSDYEQNQIVRSNGDYLTNEYWGGFLLFLPNKKELRVRRDFSGEHKCFSTWHDGVFIVFSHFGDLPFVNEIKKDIAWSTAISYMQYGFAPLPLTGLKNINELGPGEELIVSAVDKSINRRQFWKASDFYHQQVTRPKEAKRILFDALVSSIGSRSRNYDKLALFLSGGLDSSVVLASICQSGYGGEIEAHTFESTNAEDISEVSYAQAMADYYQVNLRAHPRGPINLKRALTGASTVYPFPSMKLLDDGSTDEYVDEMIAQGTQAFFTGAGGDNIFFKKAGRSVLKDYVMSNGHGLNYIRVALDLARVTEQNIFSLISDKLGDNADTISATNEFGFDDILSKELYGGINKTDFYLAHPYTRDANDLPPGKRRHLELLAGLSVYERPDDCRKTLVDFVDPLISSPVLEAVLRISSYLFPHGGQRRGLVKGAFRKALPDQIYYRQTKGFVHHMASQSITDNLTFIKEYILDGKMVSEGCFNQAKIETILDADYLVINSVSGLIRAILQTEKWVRSISDYSDSSDKALVCGVGVEISVLE